MGEGAAIEPFRRAATGVHTCDVTVGRPHLRLASEANGFEGDGPDGAAVEVQHWEAHCSKQPPHDAVSANVDTDAHVAPHDAVCGRRAEESNQRLIGEREPPL